MRYFNTIPLKAHLKISKFSQNQFLNIQGLYGSSYTFINNVFFCKNFYICYSSKNKKILKTMLTFLINKFRGFSFFFKSNLKLTGLGFKVNLLNNQLILKLGFSHIFIYTIPNFLKLKVLKKFTQIQVLSYDFQKIKQFCFILKKIKKLDVYKNKGIDFAYKKIQLKPIKKL